MADMDYEETGGAVDDTRARGRAEVSRGAKKQKGRGHHERSDASDERSRHVVHKELDPNAPAGPLKSVEGWVIFVTGVNEEAQEEDLHEAFAEHGDIKNIYLNLDRQTGFVKGYALIEYGSKAEAAAAISAFNGKELLGQVLKVDWAFKIGGGAGGRRLGGGTGRTRR